MDIQEGHPEPLMREAGTCKRCTLVPWVLSPQKKRTVFWVRIQQSVRRDEAKGIVYQLYVTG